MNDLLEEEGRLDAMEGVLVQPMLGDGTEVMMGVNQDPLFGPVVAFGLGMITAALSGICTMTRVLGALPFNPSSSGDIRSAP